MSAVDMQGKEPDRKHSIPAEPFKNNNRGGVDVGNGQCKNSSPSLNKTDGKAKSFCNDSNSPLGQDSGKSIDRSFERNSADNGYDSGIAQESNDGADSGVEVIRALSSNGSNSDRFTPFQSCGSSLVSYSSEPEIDRGSDCGSESSEKISSRRGGNDGDKSNDWKSKKTAYLKTERSRISSRKATGCCDCGGTSESCSETSSTHEPVTPDRLNPSLAADFKPSSGSNRFLDGKNRGSGKSSILRRSDSVTRKSGPCEKPSPRSRTSTPSAARVNSTSKSSLANRTGVKSEVSAKCDAKGIKEGRSSSTQRNQTTGARLRVSSLANPARKSSSNNNPPASVMSSSTGSALVSEISKSESPEALKSSALDKYGTLPRRAKKKTPDPSMSLSLLSQASLSRGGSASREPSLNRTATLRNQRSKEKDNFSNGKSLPPYPRTKKSTAKTVIYHEVSVQTVLTNEDMNGIRHKKSGIRISDKSTGSIAEKENKEVQTEGKEKLKKLEEELARRSEDLEKVKREKEELESERRKMMSKISKMLGQSEAREGGEENGENGLEELERHFQVVGLTVIRQQEELSELRRYKLIAHRDLEKSLAAQKNLLQQQQEIEEEYSELQEFLQAEKSTLSESLLDTEEELKRLKKEVAKKESLLEQQQEECKHLVRICEQRRQENLSLEVKLAGLDQRSRDVLVQQGAAVSAAAVALSGLGARLDTLVEQLSVSCDISEKDLEDVIFHNEAYNHSEDNSPEEDSSTGILDRPRGRESFLQVILGAIRNAAQSPFSKKNSPARKQWGDHSPDRLEFFDAESVSSLNLKQFPPDEIPPSPISNFADFDDSAACPSWEERKLVNELGKVSSDPDKSGDLRRSDSIQNLTEAILNRQLVEKKERSVSLEKIIPIEVSSLVDQIIEVDNSVTKLLKVIKIVQEKNERFVEGVLGERAILSQHLHQEKLNRQNSEINLKRLQQELTEARSQLNVRIAQLEEVKSFRGDGQSIAVVEMQKRFAVIDTALGALNSVQDMVNKCPPLARLRQDLEDCNFENSISPSRDLNANSAGVGKDNLNRKGPVLATAI